MWAVMIKSRVLFACALVSATVLAVACGDSQDGTTGTPDGGSTSGFDASTSDTGTTPGSDSGSDAATDAGSDAAADADADAGKILAQGLADPIPYTSRADSPFNGVAFPSYLHFEDWEDGLVNTPGVTPSSTQLGTAFGIALVDSVDGDDGVVDGKCEKAGGSCNSGFANGTIEFTFDAAVLGALPTHVGIAWTDGATNCDAIFEAYDAADVLIGSKTASAVGDNSNQGTVAEDRFFSVVHAAGVKRIVVKSSAGGIEVDHLQYGR